VVEELKMLCETELTFKDGVGKVVELQCPLQNAGTAFMITTGRNVANLGTSAMILGAVGLAVMTGVGFAVGAVSFISTAILKRGVSSITDSPNVALGSSHLLGQPHPATGALRCGRFISYRQLFGGGSQGGRDSLASQPRWDPRPKLHGKGFGAGPREAYALQLSHVELPTFCSRFLERSATGHC
jgi:hypothetical protein